MGVSENSQLVRHLLRGRRGGLEDGGPVEDKVDDLEGRADVEEVVRTEVF